MRLGLTSFNRNKQLIIQNVDRIFKTCINFLSIYLIMKIKGDTGLAEYGILMNMYNIFVLFINCGYDHFLFRHFSNALIKSRLVMLSIAVKFRILAILIVFILFQCYFYFFPTANLNLFFYFYPVMLFSINDIFEIYLISRKIEFEYFNLK